MVVKLIKYIRSEYKGWLIAILMLPFLIGFKIAFSELESISGLNSLMVILKIVCLVFVISFFAYIMYCNEFGFHESFGSREYEPEDLSRFKRHMTRALYIYAAALLIWLIAVLMVIFEYRNSENLWLLSYLLIFPIAFIVPMIYSFNKIKSVEDS